MSSVIRLPKAAAAAVRASRQALRRGAILARQVGELPFELRPGSAAHCRAPGSSCSVRTSCAGRSSTLWRCLRASASSAAAWRSISSWRAGIDVEGLQITPQRVGGLADEDAWPPPAAAPAERAADRRPPRRASAVVRLRQKVVRAGAVSFVDGGQRGPRRFREAAAPGDALLLDEQLFDRRHRRDLGLEFSELIAQQIEARFAVLRGRFERLVVAAAAAVALVDGRSRLPVRSALVQVLIEQLALCAALHQVLEFLLAVDLDQELGELAQCLHRHQLAVHIGARAAVRRRSRAAR